MRIASDSRNPCLEVLIGCGLFVFFSGCSEKTTTPAISNFVSHPPVVFSEEEQVDARQNPYPFLNREFVLATTLLAKDIRTTAELKNLEWSAVEKLAIEVAGPKWGDLNNIDRIWLLVDKSMISMETLASREKANVGLVFVLSAKLPIDLTTLPRATANENPDSAEIPDSMVALSTAPFFAVQLDSHSLLVGPKTALQHALDEAIDAPLQNLVSQLDFNKDMIGAIDFKAIAPMLQSIVQTARQFGMSEPVEDFIAVQSAQWTIDLNDAELLSATIELDDPKAVDRIAQLLNSSINEQGGGMGMLAGPPSRGLELFESTAPKAAETWFDELRTKNLASTTKTENQVQLKIMRGTTFGPLLSAIVNDTRIGIVWNNKVVQMEKIANALNTYYEQNQKLPIDGPLLESSVHVFSWRVALLPALGQQDLYDQFHFDEAPESEHNMKVAEAIPDVYSRAGSENPTHTRVRSVNAEGSYFASKNSLPLLDAIKDKKNRTAILIQVDDANAVPWTVADPVLPGAPDLQQAGDREEKAMLIVDAEFRVKAIAKQSEVIAAFQSIAGNEPISRNQFESIGNSREE